MPLMQMDLLTQMLHIFVFSYPQAQKAIRVLLSITNVVPSCRSLILDPRKPVNQLFLEPLIPEAQLEFERRRECRVRDVDLVAVLDHLVELALEVWSSLLL